MQKQVGQVEGTKVIDAELDLKVLLCSVIWGHEHPGIVEQSMQGQVAFVEISCETSNRTAGNTNTDCASAARVESITCLRGLLEGRQIQLHAVYFGFTWGLSSQLLDGCVATFSGLGCNYNMCILVHQGTSRL